MGGPGRYLSKAEEDAGSSVIIPDLHTMPVTTFSVDEDMKLMMRERPEVIWNLF